ncbi:hypothetical protein ACFL1V_03100 [Pseudomonadota bacterium]
MKNTRIQWLLVSSLLLSTTPLVANNNASVQANLIRQIDAKGIDKLKNAASGGATISVDRATGTVSFLSPEAGALKINAGVRASKPETTMAFLDSYGSVFGLQNPPEELEMGVTGLMRALEQDIIHK